MAEKVCAPLGYWVEKEVWRYF